MPPNVNEKTLKSALMLELRRTLRHPRPVLFRHEDVFTHGVPDISATWRNGTSWWEAKYADPYLEDWRGVQWQMMKDLETNNPGRAFYIIWFKTVTTERTLIVAPSDMNEWTSKAIRTFTGFDHASVAEFIRGVHSNDYVRARLFPGSPRVEDSQRCAEGGGA